MPEIWDGGIPSPTDPLLASGGESEVSAIGIGAYSFQRPIIESTLASSARFPCLHLRSRNQSPPGLVYNTVSLAHRTAAAHDGARSPRSPGGNGETDGEAETAK